MSAHIILQQLGGGTFIAMTGARNFTWSKAEACLRMKIGRNRQRITHLSIQIDASDTYTVEFIRASVRKYEVAARHEGIYCDMLADIVANETGLALSLGGAA